MHNYNSKIMIGPKGLFFRLANTLVHQKSNGKPENMKPFVPTEYGLSADFVLTNYTKMKG